MYRLLVRAEPCMVERLCMAITETEAAMVEDKTEDERETMVNWHNKRKDDTSKVLVYNSYIYPTLGTYGSTSSKHFDRLNGVLLF